VHAGFYGRQGIVIEKRPDMIIFSNPGIFRPNKSEVFEGGISDPRNPSIFKMFALIDVGERAGSGLFNIRTIVMSTIKQRYRHCEQSEAIHAPVSLDCFVVPPRNDVILRFT
jgi:predicted HTH transcriptional regulator